MDEKRKQVVVPLVGIGIALIIIFLALGYFASQSDTAASNAETAHYKACETLPVGKRTECLYPKPIYKTKTITKQVSTNTKPLTEQYFLNLCVKTAQKEYPQDAIATDLGNCIKDVVGVSNQNWLPGHA